MGIGLRLDLKFQKWYLGKLLSMQKSSLHKYQEAIASYDKASAKYREYAAIGIDHLTRRQRHYFARLNEDLKNPQIKVDYDYYHRTVEQLQASILRLEEQQNVLAKRLAASA